ncbi:MAG: 5'/3'-nucleotidase SurE [Saprospiraceae bacterium]|nr:5'/3'-nucleotidase SurE [Saprospiraceae bacterium]
MIRQPLILVTNDDGILAPGLAALVEVVREIGEVIVVAPDSPQSGKGHAITIDEPLRINEVEAFDEVRAYECSGTPVDCVKLAMNVIEKDRPFDLCVSGINHGSNASINIIYSGTLSAAMEASLEGVNSIGFSLLDYSFDADFSKCKSYIAEICRLALEHGLGETNLLNVNIPLGDIKGVRICRQAEARWVEEFQQGKDPRGKSYYWLTGRFDNGSSPEETDLKALDEGYISIVPSMHDLTHYKAIAGLTKFAEIKV